jgi:hypothetical protein
MRESGEQKFHIPYIDAGKAKSLKVPHVKSVRVSLQSVQNVSKAIRMNICVKLTRSEQTEIQADFGHWEREALRLSR